MEIRDSFPDDCALVSACDRECFGQDAWPGEAVREMLANPEMRFRLGFEGGDLVSWAVWAGGSWAHHTPQGEFVRLLSVATRPAWRRRGYAQGLLGEGAHEAAKNHYRGIMLEVRASNEAARTLYSQECFQLRQILPAWFRNPVEDGELWVKTFF